MSEREFQAWQRYGELDPYGLDRADLRMGILASVIATLSPSTRRTFRARDFMPEFGPRREQSADEIGAIFRAFARAHNRGDACGRL